MSAISRNFKEDFDVYKERRSADHAATKVALKGTLFHDSYVYGTYENPQKREYKLHNTKHGRKQLAKQGNN